MSQWHADPNFASPLSEAQIGVIASSDDVIYLLDDAWTIRAYNDAYLDFGVANGCPAIARAFGIGCSLLSVLNGTVADFYVRVYRHAIDHNMRFDHDYECSSSRVFRRFHQSVYPMSGGKALVVSHHLTREYPHAWQPQQFASRHFDERGWLTQCACCRKVKDHSEADKWDWVPRLVQHPHPRATQTYCGTCLTFCYGSTVQWSPARPEKQMHPDASSLNTAPAVSAPNSSMAERRWLLFRNLFGDWCWEQLDQSGSVVAESNGAFSTREQCEADAAAHGWNE